MVLRTAGSKIMALVVDWDAKDLVVGFDSRGCRAAGSFCPSAFASVIGFGISVPIGSQLYGIGPVDIAALSGAVLLQIGVALVACHVPARRSRRVDPMVALRFE